MDAFEKCCSLVPEEIKQALFSYPTAEELRMRCGQNPSVVIGGREVHVLSSPVKEEQILYVLERATGASIHSVADSVSNGYINYKGLRIGLCGHAIYHNGMIIGFRKYSSLSIRIPHELQVIPEEISRGLMHDLSSTLIAAPPGTGKTTALRALIRIVSENGVRVALADERGELSGEETAFSLGPCTDIISGMPKAEAALIMLKSMNPVVIAMDEITSMADLDAVFNICGCGVSVFATAHGRSREDMLHRPIYRKMFDDGVFRHLMTISVANEKREYKLERINS